MQKMQTTTLKYIYFKIIVGRRQEIDILKK